MCVYVGGGGCCTCQWPLPRRGPGAPVSLPVSETPSSLSPAVLLVQTCMAGPGGVGLGLGRGRGSARVDHTSSSLPEEAAGLARPPAGHDR